MTYLGNGKHIMEGRIMVTNKNILVLLRYISAKFLTDRS